MPRLLNRSGAPVDGAAIDAFASGLAGEAIRPGDAGYDAARRIWNAAIDRHPGLIVRCRGAADVIHAVVRPRQRPAGRGPRRRPQCRRPGALRRRPRHRPLGDARRARRPRDRGPCGCRAAPPSATSTARPTCTASRCRSASSRRPASPADARRRRRLAGAQARAHLRQRHSPSSSSPPTAALVTASADEHPDLFWALRGGGGNFGIVTSFTFRAHPVSTVLGGLIVHPRERAAELLRFYRDFMARRRRS